MGTSCIKICMMSQSDHERFGDPLMVDFVHF